MITNRESLKEKIHEIHNYMRNNGIGYGMNALKVFNFLYGLMKIEDYNKELFEEKHRFSYLLKLANEDSKITNEVIDDIIEFIYYNEKLNSLLYYEISKDLKYDVYNNLIKYIYSIKDAEQTANELLSGKVYEYFIGRDQTSISELGAYFTNRRIVEFILNKIDIQLKPDGSIPKMTDMFGGSGGFTTGYINYINENFNIDWNKNINNIYHYDINQDVLKSARLELYCLSNGVFPNENNIKKVNSFTYNFNDENKFDLIITNPPYGGDKITSAKKEKRDKVKEYLKKIIDSDIDEDVKKNRKQQLEKLKLEEKAEIIQLEKLKVNVDTCSVRLQKFASKNKLTGNDKEACSLMLMMELLEDNGLAVGVLKEGLFFDGKYKELRKFLIENYNVKAIISVPQNQFENTATKTSIIIFEKGSITKNIEFSELVVNTYEEDEFVEFNNEIHLSCCKGDIRDIKEIQINKVSKTTILNNKSYSFNYKDYNDEKIICGDDFKLVKIKDLCEFMPKSNKQASYGKDIGLYNFYTSSYNIKKCDEADYNETHLIIGTGGLINIKIDNNFSCSADNLIIKSNYDYYIYYLLLANQNLLEKGFTGSTIKHLSKNYLEQLEIPIPKTQELIDYWTNKINQPYNLKQKKEKQFKQLEDEIKNKIIHNNDFTLVKIKDLCEFMPKSNKLASYGKNNGLYNFYTSSYNIKKCHDADYKETCIIIGTGGLINIKIDNNFSCSADNLIIKSKYNYYIYYLLIANQNLLEKGFTGSTIKHLSKNYLEQLEIPIPKDKSLIDNLQPLFDEIEVLQKEIKELDENYNEYLQELSKSAIKDNEEVKKKIKEEVKEDTNSKKSLTVNDLRDQCTSLGIKGYSKKKKEELIELIKNHK